MHQLGLDGMPRRVADYAPEFCRAEPGLDPGRLPAGDQHPAVHHQRARQPEARGEVAGPNPWRALGLEWTVSSPPPVHNFPVPPVVDGDPYGYGET